MKTISKNTRVWIHGLVAAIVSGFGTFLAGLAVDIESGKLVKLILITVGISVGLYLKQSPLPPPADPPTT